MSARKIQRPSATFPVSIHLLAPACALLTHAVVVVCQLKAGEAEAVVGAHRVFTSTVAARLSVTLVDI